MMASGSQTSHQILCLSLRRVSLFVAVVLCYWDNVLGPRLQHVWRVVGDAEFQVNDPSNHRQSRLTIKNPLGQIITICMGIDEHEFDKTVKMHINSHLTVCLCCLCMYVVELSLCCFLTVP